jgi:hypothetical protein
MCDTCPCNSVSSIPGPGEVAGRMARSKLGRKILFLTVFWGFCIPMLPFAVWGIFGWWTIALAAVAAAVSGAGLAYMKVMGRHTLLAVPDTLRDALPAPRRRVALPRNLSLTRGRRALPAPAKALPAAEVVVGKVVPAPVRGKVVG